MITFYVWLFSRLAWKLADILFKFYLCHYIVCVIALQKRAGSYKTSHKLIPNGKTKLKWRHIKVDTTLWRQRCIDIYNTKGLGSIRGVFGPMSKISFTLSNYSFVIWDKNYRRYFVIWDTLPWQRGLQENKQYFRNNVLCLQLWLYRTFVCFDGSDFSFKWMDMVNRCNKIASCK